MKNKKILGALAALCMGIILCVSSVFAVNYWYKITNKDNTHTVTMGNALSLTLEEANNEEKYLYPGGYVTFNDITITGALNWNWNDLAGKTQTDNIVNVELPKFALRVKALNNGKADEALVETTAGLNEEFTVYQNFDSATFVGAEATDDTLAAEMLILDDLQAKADAEGKIVFDLRLKFDDMASMNFANGKLVFTLEIVAYLGTSYETATEIFVAADDLDTSLEGSNPANAEEGKDING